MKNQIEIFMVITAEEDATDQAIERIRQYGEILNLNVVPINHKAIENAWSKAFTLTTEDRKETSNASIQD